MNCGSGLNGARLLALKIEKYSIDSVEVYNKK